MLRIMLESISMSFSLLILSTLCFQDSLMISCTYRNVLCVSVFVGWRASKIMLGMKIENWVYICCSWVRGITQITIPIRAKPEERAVIRDNSKSCHGLTILYHSYCFERCKRTNKKRDDIVVLTGTVNAARVTPKYWRQEMHFVPFPLPSIEIVLIEQ